jgi:tetratricopeptide (TPR) repeat protein
MRRLLLALCLAACQNPPAREPAPAKPAAPPPATPAPAAASATAPAAKEQTGGLPWFEDDPDGALAEAKRLKKPLLVDLWAPWCHTCLSMKSYILTAKNLAGESDRFVFLSLNTEREKSAAFLEKYPVEVWPTFYVLDPDGGIAGRWLGAASVEQLTTFLKDGERAALAAASPPPAGDPMALLLEGDREAAKKSYLPAAKRYLDALKAAPKDWARRPDALVSAITALYRAKDFGTCVDLGAGSMADTGDTSSATDFAAFALSCAEELPKEEPRLKELYTKTEARLAALAGDPNARLSPDDRSDAYANLRDVRERLGDAAGAKEAAKKQLAVLEEAERGVPDDVALLYDWALAEAYLYLERADDALALLHKREKALQDNYNPPHYLARAYLKLKRPDDAAKWIDRALTLSYGPRKAGMMGLKADILEAQKKPAEAKAAVEEQLSLYRALPEGQKQPSREEAVAARLAKMK